MLRLLWRMKEIPLGAKGLHVALVDDDDYEMLMRHKWHRHKLGYAYRIVWRGRVYVKAIYMHREIFGNPSGEVDHINRRKLDNRRSNLRITSRSMNGANRGPQSNNTSGYCGVNWNKGKNRWESRLKINKSVIRLGYYLQI